MPETNKNYKDIIADSQKAPSKEVWDQAKTTEHLKKETSEGLKRSYSATLNEIEEVANKGLVFGQDRRQALKDIATIARKALRKE